MKIKIGIRNNLFYPLMIIIFTFFRKADTIIMSKSLEFDGSLLLTLIMFLSEFITGLFFYLFYYNYIISKQITSKKSNNNIKLNPPDSLIKIYFLIFMVAYFDFFVFILQTFYFPKFLQKESKSLDIRLRCSLIISSSIICYYLLRLKIYRHHKFVLLIILSCFMIVAISEYIFEIFLKEENGNSFLRFLIFLIIYYVFYGFLDIIEKYLLEVDNINAFKMLMLEGIFGLILTIIYSFLENPFEETKIVYDRKDKIDFILLIILFFIYFITSGGRNLYRVITNKLYSPMAKTLTDSFLDPLFIIYYYISGDDFKDSNNKKNIYFFIINVIISIIIVFCGCVYNELFVLFCCNLEHETYRQISKRARETKIELTMERILDIDDNYYTTLD